MIVQAVSEEKQTVDLENITSLLDNRYNDKLIKVRHEISRIKSEVNKCNYNSKAKVVKKYIEYIKLFSGLGVQGIAGIVRLKKLDFVCVFKVSCQINSVIQHEQTVLRDLNELSNFNPHFVRELGSINFPISSFFLYDPKNHDLFHDEQCFPSEMIFLELANPIPLYKICRESHDKNIVASLVIQTMMALQIAQTHKKFTHYDLHTSNIIIQECEIDSIFLYLNENGAHLVPTYGFYPLIIDTGLSYSIGCDNKSMKSTIEHVKYGFQCTVFDPLNDVHHFLLSLFYYLEDHSDSLNSISNKIKLIFRHLPVLRKNGWKILEHDIGKTVIQKLDSSLTNVDQYPIYSNNKLEVIELCHPLIILPIQNFNDTEFDDCFPVMMNELHKLVNCEVIDDNWSQLFIFREVVNTIARYKDDYFKSSNDRKNQIKILQLIRNVIRERTFHVIDEKLNYNINYEHLLVSMSVFVERLQSNYYQMLQDHNQGIIEAYRKTIVKSPIDFYTYICRNMTPHFHVTNSTIVYVWDVTQKPKKLNLNRLNNEQIDLLNQTNFVFKGNVLKQILNI